MFLPALAHQPFPHTDLKRFHKREALDRPRHSAPARRSVVNAATPAYLLLVFPAGSLPPFDFRHLPESAFDQTLPFGIRALIVPTMSTAQGGALVTFDAREHVLSAASVTFPPTSGKGLGKKSRELSLFRSPFSPSNLAVEFVGPFRRIPEAVFAHKAVFISWRIHCATYVADPRPPFEANWPQGEPFSARGFWRGSIRTFRPASWQVRTPRSPRR